MPGGGGGGTSTVQIPDYIDNLARQNVADVERLTQRPYQPYTLPRIADFTPDQQAGFQVARNSVGVGQQDIDRARGALDSVIGFNPSNVSARDTALRTMTAPGDVSARTLPGTDISSYLNPFIQQAIDPALRQISEKAQADRSAMGAGQALSGAFGSDQSAIMQGMSMRDENQLRSDAIAQGLFGGYDRATGLAQSDADRLLNAAVQNQTMGFNVGNTNLQSLLGTDRFNAGQDLTAQQLNQAAQLQANAQRLAAAQASGGLAPTAQGVAQNDASALLGIGGAQQQMGQQSLDLAYNDFLRQQMDPFNMINLRTAVMSGQPYSVQQQSAGEGKGGALGGLGSLATGAAALGTTFCHVAREVYGESNPKWLAFRRWVVEDAPSWFRDLYVEHGPAVARWLRDKPEEKALVRAWMDEAVA